MKNSIFILVILPWVVFSCLFFDYALFRSLLKRKKPILARDDSTQHKKGSKISLAVNIMVREIDKNNIATIIIMAFFVSGFLVVGIIEIMAAIFVLLS